MKFYCEFCDEYRKIYNLEMSKDKDADTFCSEIVCSHCCYVIATIEVENAEDGKTYNLDVVEVSE